MLKKLVVLSVLSLSLCACSSAPSKEQVKEAVKKIIPVEFQVLEVQELKEIPGLVEVVIKAGNQPLVIYMDKKAKYVISGSLMSLETRANLTMATQNKYRQQK